MSNRWQKKKNHKKKKSGWKIMVTGIVSVGTQYTINDEQVRFDFNFFRTKLSISGHYVVCFYNQEKTSSPQNSSEKNSIICDSISHNFSTVWSSNLPLT